MPKSRSRRPARRRWLAWLLPLVLIGAAAVALYAVHLDRVIRDKFEGQLLLHLRFRALDGPLLAFGAFISHHKYIFSF